MPHLSYSGVAHDVLIDERPARACQVSVAAAAGKRITTIEGLGSPARPHPVQAAFIAE